ncbi:eCIS core domain-containing protein, partial [Streptomyces sp. NPDC004561]
NNDFSAAVLHDGPVAQRATEAMGAQAMTVGTPRTAAPRSSRRAPSGRRATGRAGPSRPRGPRIPR